MHFVIFVRFACHPTNVCMHIRKTARHPVCYGLYREKYAFSMYNTIRTYQHRWMIPSVTGAFTMRIAILTVTLHAPFVHSLKDKRTHIKRLATRIRSKFNVSIAESACQDMHQTIEVTVAALAFDAAQADSILDHIINHIECNTEAVITRIIRDIR